MVVHGANVIRKRIKQREKELLTADPARLSWIHGAIYDLQWAIEDEPEIPAEIKANIHDYEEREKLSAAEEAAKEIKAAEDLIAQEDPKKPDHGGPPLETFDNEKPARKPICSLYDEQPELNETGYPTGAMEEICNETDLDATCPEDRTCPIKEFERFTKKAPEPKPAPTTEEIIG